MSENENIDPKKPARTSKASATPHKPGWGIGGIKALISPGQGRWGPAAGWLAVAGAQRATRSASPIPHRATHRLRSCAGDRGAVKTRPAGAESNAETGTDY
jgi:hypothetical protein